MGTHDEETEKCIQKFKEFFHDIFTLHSFFEEFLKAFFKLELVLIVRM